MLICRFPSSVHALCFREEIVSFGWVDFAVALTKKEDEDDEDDEEIQNASLGDFEFGR